MTFRMMPRMMMVAITALLLQGQAHGFSRPPSAATLSRGSELAMTWSMPSPPSMNSLSWYTEEDSVIQSSIVYEDNEPLPYTFATPGDDWFSSMGAGEALLAVQPADNTNAGRLKNPIRRAVRWARQGFRRST